MEEAELCRLAEQIINAVMDYAVCDQGAPSPEIDIDAGCDIDDYEACREEIMQILKSASL